MTDRPNFNADLWTWRIRSQLAIPRVTFVDEVNDPADGQYFAFTVDNVGSAEDSPARMDVYIERATLALNVWLSEKVSVYLNRCLREKVRVPDVLLIACVSDVQILRSSVDKKLIVRGQVMVSPAVRRPSEAPMSAVS